MLYCWNKNHGMVWNRTWWNLPQYASSLVIPDMSKNQCQTNHSCGNICKCDSWQYFPNMKLMILALNGVFIDTKKHSFSLLQKMHFNTLFCIMRYTSVSAFPLRNSLLILNSFKLLLPLSVFWNDVEIKLHCKQFQIVSF